MDTINLIRAIKVTMVIAVENREKYLKAKKLEDRIGMWVVLPLLALDLSTHVLLGDESDLHTIISNVTSVMAVLFMILLVRTRDKHTIYTESLGDNIISLTGMHIPDKIKEVFEDEGMPTEVITKESE